MALYPESISGLPCCWNCLNHYSRSGTLVNSNAHAYRGKHSSAENNHVQLGFEYVIPNFKWSKSLRLLNRAATGIGRILTWVKTNRPLAWCVADFDVPHYVIVKPYNAYVQNLRLITQQFPVFGTASGYCYWSHSTITLLAHTWMFSCYSHMQYLVATLSGLLLL